MNDDEFPECQRDWQVYRFPASREMDSPPDDLGTSPFDRTLQVAGKKPAKQLRSSSPRAVGCTMGERT